jgi:hypothetical protein
MTVTKNEADEGTVPAKDLLADGLVKLDATIEGSLVFVLGFLATWWRLCLAPGTVLRPSVERRAIPFTRPLTFMVLSVVSGSVAVRVLVRAFIRDGGVEQLKVAQELAAAYASMSFFGTLLEALPVTVGVLGATRWAVARLECPAGVRKTITDTLCYGVGLQFTLLFVASVLTIATPEASSRAVDYLAWAYIAYIFVVPSVLMYAYTRSLTNRRLALVSGAVAISTLVLALGMALSLLPLALPG